MGELLNQFNEVLESIGIYNVQQCSNLKIREIIEDSLTYISFFLELENKFKIEIPDEVYSEEIYYYTVTEFIKKIIIPLQKK